MWLKSHLKKFFIIFSIQLFAVGLHLSLYTNTGRMKILNSSPLDAEIEIWTQCLLPYESRLLPLHHSAILKNDLSLFTFLYYLVIRVGGFKANRLIFWQERSESNTCTTVLETERFPIIFTLLCTQGMFNLTLTLCQN